MTPRRQAFIGIGGNLGDRLAILTAAVERLRTLPRVDLAGVSPIYETKPVGKTDQPLFLNAVAGIETTLTPEELLQALGSIEQEFGRVRTERWGPRTLDLDLLAFEGETRVTESLQLPHPRMLERAFVTVPLGVLLGKSQFQRKAWDHLRQQTCGGWGADDVKLFQK